MFGVADALATFGTVSLVGLAGFLTYMGMSNKDDADQMRQFNETGKITRRKTKAKVSAKSAVRSAAKSRKSIKNNEDQGFDFGERSFGNDDIFGGGNMSRSFTGGRKRQRSVKSKSRKKPKMVSVGNIGFRMPQGSKRYKKSVDQFKSAYYDANFKNELRKTGCYKLKKYNCTAEHTRKILNIDNKECMYDTRYAKCIKK